MRSMAVHQRKDERMALKRLQTIFLISSAIAIAAFPVCAQTRTDRAQTGSSAAQSPAGGDAAMTGKSPAGRTQTSPVTPQSSAGMAASSEEIQKLQQALKDRGQDPGRSEEPTSELQSRF